MSSESTPSKLLLSPHRTSLKISDDNPSTEHDLSSAASEESHTLLSETVTTLASSVYNELERIIKKFGENSVKDLMPVMISALESLDNALHEREVSKLEIDSLKEQNEQLFQQYEREKNFHKEYQQRYLQVEDNLEETKRENDEKLQSLESIVKIFEIKARNAGDHVARLEEKENEMKTEYKRLHERYCELFKAHCDYMERTKILYGTDRVDPLQTAPHISRSRGNLQLPFSSQQTRSHLSDNQHLTANEPLTEETTPTHPDISFPISKRSTNGANFGDEAAAANGTQTQTEAIATSSDAAVNTAKKRETKPSDHADEMSLEDMKRGIFDNIRGDSMPDPFDVFDPTSNPPDLPISDDDDDTSGDSERNYEDLSKEIQNDGKDIFELDSSADLFGMTKEVSNLIKENNELLETKNALNVVKDDLLSQLEELTNDKEFLRGEIDSLQTIKSRLQTRVTEVEEELRKTRDELDRKKKEEEDDLPTGERKRFTRIEMQRILNERNSYKQRFLELEEAVHRGNAMRASKHEQHQSSTINDQSLSQSHHKQQTTFWKMFSGLFGSAEKNAPVPHRRATLRPSSSSEQSSPRSSQQETPPKNQSVSESPVVIDTPTQPAASSARRGSSILINDDNRLQAYGWSLSSKNQLKLSEVNGKVQVNVPVPVYCRPIFSVNDTTQIWCAVGIDLTGSPLNIDENALSIETSLGQLEKQLIESYHQMIDEQCLKLSSIVWIAAKSNGQVMITIIDSNKAEKIIDTFPLGTAVVYAMGSVSGPSSIDYPPFDASKWTLFEADTASASDVTITPCTVASLSTGGARPTVSEVLSAESKKSNDDSNTSVHHEIKPNFNTKYPTVWLGSSDGWLCIHSAICDHRKTVEKVWLRHAIYSIVHVRGRVFVALANEKIVVFHRNADGSWNLNNIHLIVTGKSRESVRCMINVGESIWCGVANRIYVIDAQTLEVRKQFDVHSRPEHSVQHMTWSGDGVWLSIRLSSTLQLYHAQTFQHLQDVDVQPYVEKMIATEKAGLYLVHISALTIACRRLWIGTGNGIIISVPLTDSTPTTAATPTSNRPGSVVRIYDQPVSNYIPYCSMNNAQLSFHGYRDAVKFFIAVPGQPPSKLLSDDESHAESLPAVHSSETSNLAFGDILVVSGGDGYIDFRIGHSTAERTDDLTANNNRNASHLIVWHLGSV